MLIIFVLASLLIHCHTKPTPNWRQAEPAHGTPASENRDSKCKCKKNVMEKSVLNKHLSKLSTESKNTDGCKTEKRWVLENNHCACNTKILKPSDDEPLCPDNCRSLRNPDLLKEEDNERAELEAEYDREHGNEKKQGDEEESEEDPEPEEDPVPEAGGEQAGQHGNEKGKNDEDDAPGEYEEGSSNHHGNGECCGCNNRDKNSGGTWSKCCGTRCGTPCENSKCAYMSNASCGFTFASKFGEDNSGCTQDALSHIEKEQRGNSNINGDSNGQNSNNNCNACNTACIMACNNNNGNVNGESGASIPTGCNTASMQNGNYNYNEGNNANGQSSNIVSRECSTANTQNGKENCYGGSNNCSNQNCNSINSMCNCCT